MPAEITRRINEDEAGIGFKAAVKERTIKEWLQKHAATHGGFADPPSDAVNADSFDRLRKRAVALANRELSALERKHPGKMKREDVAKMKELLTVVAQVERQEEAATKRRREPTRAKRAGAPKPEDPRDAVSALAEELAGEQNGDGEHEQPPEAGQETAHAGLTPVTNDTRTAAGQDEASAGEGRNGHEPQRADGGVEAGPSSPEPRPITPVVAHIR